MYIDIIMKLVAQINKHTFHFGFRPQFRPNIYGLPLYLSPHLANLFLVNLVIWLGLNTTFDAIRGT